MNDREVLSCWHRGRLNETLDEQNMRMDSNPPRSVLAALHRENEREEAESAMLPTSHSSSNNDGRENAVGTVRTTHHVGGRNVSGPPQNSRIEGSADSAVFVVSRDCLLVIELRAMRTMMLTARV